MGIYIKTRRTFLPGIPYNEAARHKALSALELLSPFREYLTVTFIGVYRHVPVRSRSAEEPLTRHVKIKGSGVIGGAAEVLKAFLDRAVERWRTLYGTYVVVEALYEPPGEPGVPLYLAASNGAPSMADIELDSYDWIHNGRVIESLEESLGVVGYPGVKDLFRAVSRLHKKLSTHAMLVDKAVLSKQPEALEDMTQARAVWLPTEAKLLSYALDTLEYLREFEKEMADLYDYYQPYKKSLVISLIANSREYRTYINSGRVAREAIVTPMASILVESRSDTLKELFNLIREDILEPFAKEVLETRNSDIKLRAFEYLKHKLAEKFSKRS
ncbi:MAG: hypothetical protein F7B17_07760 [Desulfurococcales archaeon]|nr:hypothetical protein [Desulfurococcales archaeon]